MTEVIRCAHRHHGQPCRGYLLDVTPDLKGATVRPIAAKTEARATWAIVRECYKCHGWNEIRLPIASEAA